MNNPLVTAKWLHENIKQLNLIILDASLKENPALKTTLQNPQIPGARFFDIKNDFSDKKGKFPNTFPTVEQFENACRELGINNDSFLVIYDKSGIFSAPRAWWMFKTMGHENVFVLDGGLPGWIEQGYDIEERTETSFSKGNFKATPNLNKVKDIDFISRNIETKETLVLDARSSGRFNGTAPEPREGLRSGHIPNSMNLPFTKVLNGHYFKTKEELIPLFAPYKNEERPLTFSCGSGITACIILLASEFCVKNTKFVYDGSWTEWATLKD